MDLGFKLAGFQLVWANDFDKDAVETYKANIADHCVCADISKIPAESIPDCDIMIGGSLVRGSAWRTHPPRPCASTPNSKTRP